jgi:hypothetical protein
MTKTTTIQISIYDWGKMEELICESQIGSIEDLVVLSYRFDKSVKYKKPTDKNWYYCKTMIKRLFRDEITAKNDDVKLVTSNDLKKILEEKFQAKLNKQNEKTKLEHFILYGNEETTAGNIIF